MLTEVMVIDILQYIGVTKIGNFNSKGEIQFCCPIHQENTPSMGYSISKNVCNCLSCHFSGSISWLIFNANRDEFKSIQEVDQWIKSRYNVDFISWTNKELDDILIRYEDFEKDAVNKRFELPNYYIAPYRSGNETYKYFFKRGFTKKTMQEFKIGRDLEQKTVTIPLFWEDETLAGVIGRKISSKVPKNARYIVYEFPKGEIIYPMNKITPYINSEGQRVFILVEGILDALWMHQLGFTNTFGVLGNSVTVKQRLWIQKNCDKLINMSDNDKGGVKLSEILKEHLDAILDIEDVIYPENKKDPQECSKEEIKHMLANTKNKLKIKLERI